MNKKTLLALNNTELDKAVIIAGTPFDRRRKVTKDMERRFHQMYKAGKSYKEIADKYGLDPRTVRAKLDEEYHQWRLWERKQYPASKSPSNSEERGAYKRSLIEKRKKVIVK